jgi:hypothetical protein
MTQNAAMVKALETRLGSPLCLPPDGLGQLNGAFGAALLGLRRVERLLAEGRPITVSPAEGLQRGPTTRRWSTFVPAGKTQAVAGPA